MIRAAHDNDIKEIYKLITSGANINEQDYLGNSVLHYCVYNPVIIEFSLVNGANPNIQNNNLVTPLHIIAANLFNEDIGLSCICLLDGGADPNIKNKYGRTPLHVACRENNLFIVQLLVSRGADLGALDNYGNNPLLYLSNKKFAEYLLGLSYKPIENGEICSICLDDNSNTELPCGHQFHKECINGWVRTCPNCRKKFFGRHKTVKRFLNKSKKRNSKNKKG